MQLFVVLIKTSMLQRRLNINTYRVIHNKMPYFEIFEWTIIKIIIGIYIIFSWHLAICLSELFCFSVDFKSKHIYGLPIAQAF